MWSLLELLGHAAAELQCLGRLAACCRLPANLQRTQLLGIFCDVGTFVLHEKLQFELDQQRDADLEAEL